MFHFRLFPLLSILIGTGIPLQAAMAQEDHGHAMHAHQAGMLTEPGNDAFGTIQEVVARLNADPATDWSRVNLEALRQHLIDMHEFTLNVQLVRSKPVKHGVEVVVHPVTTAAHAALGRALSAHPKMLKQESGWDMAVTPLGRDYKLRITDPAGKATDKIRGLGYIGIMAMGDHHRMHHWMMATGRNPH